MQGKYTIELGAAEFVRGMSTGLHLPDGGFSNETDAVNLTGIAGVLYPSAGAINKSTNMTGDPIAWCSANVATLLNGYILSNSGYIHSISSAQVLTAAASALTGTFTAGKSDIVQFIDKIYASSDTDVAQMATDLTGGDHDWWSVTQAEGVLTAGVPHPLCLFQDRMWIGDLNTLHRATAATTTDQDVLVLSSHHVITALVVDPSSGKMLIATTQDTAGGNYSGTLSVGNSIFTYDGTSSTYTREYQIDGPVTGFHTVGGVVYVGYGGNKIGYWNGSGITYLRTLKNVTLSGAELPYKHHMAHIDNTLYIVDGKQVLTYGEITAGQKVWYYAHSNAISANKYDLIANVGNKKLGLGFATAAFYTVNTTDVGSASTSGAMTFKTNFYKFPRPVFLRHARIEYEGTLADGVSGGILQYKTQGGGNLFNNLSSLTNSSGTDLYEMTDIIGFADDKVTGVQFSYALAAGVSYGIRRILIYYDVAE